MTSVVPNSLLHLTSSKISANNSRIGNILLESLFNDKAHEVNIDQQLLLDTTIMNQLLKQFISNNMALWRTPVNLNFQRHD